VDELATTIAAALVTKGADAVIAGGKSAIDALVRLIRARFGEGTREGALVRAAEVHPDDAALQSEFSHTLARVMARDPPSAIRSSGTGGASKPTGARAMALTISAGARQRWCRHGTFTAT
jgi:hypothetical protein